MQRNGDREGDRPTLHLVASSVRGDDLLVVSSEHRTIKRAPFNFEVSSI